MSLRSLANVAVVENSSTPNPIADAARDYIRRGYLPLPAQPRAKSVKIEGWPNLVIPEDQVDYYFSDPQGNVGLLTGEIARDLVDGDLDCPEAISAADYFLPDTALRHGRVSRRDSHRWYRTTTPISPEQFLDIVPKKNRDKYMLAELRSTGQQTIVPPSVQESGELLAWEEEGEPALVDAQELRAAMRKTAAVALVARHWPKLGARQSAALALSGFLLRAKWSVDDVERFVEAVAVAAKDDELEKRVRTVEGTAEQLNAGGPTTGGGKLAELLSDGKEVVRKLRQWLLTPIDEQVADDDAADTAVERFYLTDLGNAERLVVAGDVDTRKSGGVPKREIVGPRRSVALR